jgi:F-type H+-transporting ATPase subunit a
MLIMTYRKKPLRKFGRYIGTGIPAALGPIIGVCEVVRMLVRPVALGLRLGANMLAGHAILALVTNCFRYRIINLRAIRGSIFFIASFGFFLFEAAVCVIQAYVFILLLRIYVSEYPL